MSHPHSPSGPSSHQNPHSNFHRSKHRHSRESQAVPDEAIGISTITRIPNSDQPQSHNLIVYSREVYSDDRETIASWVHDSLRFCSDEAGEAVVVCVEGWQNGLDEALKGAIPRYPDYLAKLVNGGRNRHPYVTSESGAHHRDIAFVLNHRGGDGHSRSNPDIKDADRETRVGAWIGSVGGPPDSAIECGPLIVLLFPKHEEDPNYHAKLLRDQYAPYLELFGTLKPQPLFVFMDLYRMFTRWENVLDKIGNACDVAEKSSTGRASRVIPRVTNIHKLLGGITRVRQQLHIHDLARKRISKFAEDSKGQDQRLLYRLEDVEDELSTQMLVLDMLSERLKNMVDMEFNVASARTDIRVAAISVLAFAIAPVGFVASIFGMTTFSADIKYFAISAPIVAVFSVLIWFVIDAYYTRKERQYQSLSASNERRKRPLHDSEMGSPDKGFEQYDVSGEQRIYEPKDGQ